MGAVTRTGKITAESLSAWNLEPDENLVEASVKGATEEVLKVALSQVISSALGEKIVADVMASALENTWDNMAELQITPQGVVEFGLMFDDTEGPSPVWSGTISDIIAETIDLYSDPEDWAAGLAAELDKARALLTPYLPEASE